ncbi:MAG: hypothetical protein H0V73_11125, partial [Chloroflexi bacterium]|nr:hypothetical protein [Chloroflexota bacterium]
MDWLATLPIVLLLPIILMSAGTMFAGSWTKDSQANTSSASAPQLSASPSSVAPGASIKVSGLRFKSKTAGVLTLGTDRAHAVPYAANNRGSFTVLVKVPTEAARGSLAIAAIPVIGGIDQPAAAATVVNVTAVA